MSNHNILSKDFESWNEISGRTDEMSTTDYMYSSGILLYLNQAMREVLMEQPRDPKVQLRNKLILIQKENEKKEWSRS